MNMHVIVTKAGKGFWVCGQTTPAKFALKAHGGTWNRAKKCWIFPISKLPDIMVLLELPESKIKYEEGVERGVVRTLGNVNGHILQFVASEPDQELRVCGETTPFKKHFKDLGGVWNRERQCWLFTLDKLPDVTLKLAELAIPGF